MDYLFLHRDKRTFFYFRKAEESALPGCPPLLGAEVCGQRSGSEKGKSIVSYINMYCIIWKCAKCFLTRSFHWKKLSEMIETNQTYLSNVVNRYFGCHLKELVNTYRVEYAKELLRSGKCPPEELPQRCGFLSRSAFYAAFKKVTGASPKRYMKYGQREKLSEPTEYV